LESLFSSDTHDTAEEYPYNISGGIGEGFQKRDSRKKVEEGTKLPLDRGFQSRQRCSDTQLMEIDEHELEDTRVKVERVVQVRQYMAWALNKH